MRHDQARRGFEDSLSSNVDIGVKGTVESPKTHQALGNKMVVMMKELLRVVDEEL